MANFNILDHIDRLTSDGGSQTKTEKSYHCPVCNSSNFKITVSGPKTGVYQGYGCDCMSTNTGKQSIIDAINPRFKKEVRSASKSDFQYNDANGNPIAKLTRSDDGNGKRKFYQSYYSGGRWVTGIPDEIKLTIPLYRIYDRINRDAIANGQQVLIVEGEGNADRSIALGIPATCSIGGAGKWKYYGQNYRAELEGAKVVICPDRDEPGIKHAEQVAVDFPDAEWLYADPNSFEWDSVSKGKGFDIGDWISQGATKEQILGAIEPKRLEKKTEIKPANNGDEKPTKRAVADQLIDIGQDSNISYFVTPEDVVYADVMIEQTRATWAIREKQFKQYLRSIQFDNTARSPGSDAVQQAIDTLEALAMRKPYKRSVHVRLAGHEGRVYIDLADESWQAIEIDCHGWRIVNDAPVRFVRRASASLPMPIAGGTVEEFRSLCQFDDDAWTKILPLLIQGISPELGYSVVLLHGGAGSGKTTMTRALKRMIDPSATKPRKSVGDVREFAIHATRRHVVAIDNLSGLSAEQSDILCTASTGGGHSQRTLHSDSDETTHNFCNLLILNGIDTIATRGDLLSRSVPITIHPPEYRLSEREFEAALEEMQPRVFGALLSLLSSVMGVLPTIEYVGNGERFPQFIKIGLAVEHVMKWDSGTFLRVIGEARDEAHETAIESSPVGQAILALMNIHDSWTGTMAELLSGIRKQCEESVVRSKYFPTDATRLSKTLNRLAPDLEAIGIGITRSKANGDRRLTLSRVVKPT